MRKGAFYTARIRKSLETALNAKREKDGRFSPLNTYIEEILFAYVTGRIRECDDPKKNVPTPTKDRALH